MWTEIWSYSPHTSTQANIAPPDRGHGSICTCTLAQKKAIADLVQRVKTDSTTQGALSHSAS